MRAAALTATHHATELAAMEAAAGGRVEVRGARETARVGTRGDDANMPSYSEAEHVRA